MSQVAVSTGPLEKADEFFQSKDGVRLFMTRVVPAEPRALVLVVHGYGDHAGRYAHVLEALANAGYAACALDYRGHGQAAGRRGYCAKFGDFLDDLRAGIALVRSRHPSLPFFIVAHSHGALMTAELLASGEQVPGLAGVAFSSPYFQLAIDPSWFQLFQAKVVGRIVPFLPVKSPLKLEQLSRDAAWVASTGRDPLYGRVVTPKWFTESTAVQRALLAKAPQFTAPLLVLQGGADSIARPAGAKAFFDAVGSQDKRYNEYAGYFHEIFNDTGREAPLGELVEWLNAHVPAEASA